MRTALRVLFLVSYGFTALGQTPTFKNSMGVEFALIPAGSFRMGEPVPICAADDPFTTANEYQDCMNHVVRDETPQRTIYITQPFYLGRYEVTQEQWYSVMGSNPSTFKGESVGGNSRRHPVEDVPYDVAKEFIRRLNEKEGTSAYRLPTEAEWEYACRAGTTDDAYGRLDSIAWYRANAGGITHSVGTKAPNAWKLYDMLGNVLEWADDWYDDSYYSNSSSIDPVNDSRSCCRVLRGGSWDDAAVNVRAGRRSGSCRPEAMYHCSAGFRIARTIESRTAFPASRSPKDRVLDEAFASAVYGALKANDASALIALLPKPPFVINYLYDDGAEKTKSIDAEAFAKYTASLQSNLRSIVKKLAAEGVQLEDVSLAKITVLEYTSVTVVGGGPRVGIYLLLDTPKGSYRIRVEDCVRVGGKYLPELLKWRGKGW